VEYNGKPLGFWLDRLLSDRHREEETIQALRHIGPPAAGPLVQLLTLTASPLRRHYTVLRSKLPASLNKILPHHRLFLPLTRLVLHEGPLAPRSLLASPLLRALPTPISRPAR
jgi:hypothetical protein